MAIYTNETSFGGSLRQTLAKELDRSEEASIASGYFSSDVIRSFTPHIRNLLSRGGKFTLTIGMGFFEGLAASNYEALKTLFEVMRQSKSGNGDVRLVHFQKFHGKVYYFRGKNHEEVFAGSSNFSFSGLTSNLEYSSRIVVPADIYSTRKFLEWLNMDKQSASLPNVQDLYITGTPAYSEILHPKGLLGDNVRKFDVSTIDKAKLPYFDIPLDRIDEQQHSNLNAYFGKGRWSRRTGVVVPRNWFEVEIIVDAQTIKNPLYPKGDFKVITDDGFEFGARTQGDNFKNLRSKPRLEIFGKWIKRKLQDSGSLSPLEPVTSETLELYGRDYIRMYMISASTYLMEF